MELPKRFALIRDVDVTGVSGEGVVAIGVEFPDGRVVMRWCVPDKPNSITIYDSLDDVQTIHGHDGKTWINLYDTGEANPKADEDLRHWQRILREAA